MQVQGEIRRSGFIDPKLLHIQSPVFDIEPDARMRVLWEEHHDELVFDHLQGLSGDDEQLFESCEHNVKAIPDSHESYGFAISSGWSSTFFPYGMNDDSDNDGKINIAEYSI